MSDAKFTALEDAAMQFVRICDELDSLQREAERIAKRRDELFASLSDAKEFMAERAREFIQS